MAMRITTLEVSEWGTAKVSLTVGDTDGKERRIVLFKKFCRRDEAVKNLQGFLDANPTLEHSYISVGFEPTADVGYIKHV